MAPKSGDVAPRRPVTRATAPLAIEIDPMRQVWKPPRRRPDEGQPSASSAIAELWALREAPPRLVQSPVAAPQPAPAPPGRTSKTGLIAAVVAVAVLLGAGVGVFLAGSGGGAPSKAKFIAAADAICARTNTPIVALAKPSSYPELGSAVGTVVTAADTQVAELEKLKVPGGTEGVQAKGVFSALSATDVAVRGLQSAAAGKDDALTANAATEVSTQLSSASAQAQAFGFTACGTGMRGGMDNLMGGTNAVIKTSFVAKADSLCREGSRTFEAIPMPSKDVKDVARYFGQLLQVSNKLLADLKALPVPPGDGAVVADMLAAQENVLAGFAEMRDALMANDARRYAAATAQEATLTTAADAKFDAYGLRVCGSNFGG